MVALEGDKSKDCFLVGTLSVRGVRDVPKSKQPQEKEQSAFLPPNDVQLLEFNEDTGEVKYDKSALVNIAVALLMSM